MIPMSEPTTDDLRAIKHWDCAKVCNWAADRIDQLTRFYESHDPAEMRAALVSVAIAEQEALVKRDPTTDDLTERLCEEMHDRYEAAAAGAGWETNPESRKPWADVPEANKVTMRAAIGPIADRIDQLEAKFATTHKANLLMQARIDQYRQGQAEALDDPREATE